MIDERTTFDNLSGNGTPQGPAVPPPVPSNFSMADKKPFVAPASGKIKKDKSKIINAIGAGIAGAAVGGGAIFGASRLNAANSDSETIEPAGETKTATASQPAPQSHVETRVEEHHHHYHTESRQQPAQHEEQPRQHGEEQHNGAQRVSVSDNGQHGNGSQHGNGGEEPEIKVLGVYEDEQNGMYVAELRVNGHAAYAIDGDADHNVDMIVVDVNDNGDVDDGEVIDMRGQGLTIEMLAVNVEDNPIDNPGPSYVGEDIDGSEGVVINAVDRSEADVDVEIMDGTPDTSGPDAAVIAVDGPVVVSAGLETMDEPVAVEIDEPDFEPEPVEADAEAVAVEADPVAEPDSDPMEMADPDAFADPAPYDGGDGMDAGIDVDDNSLMI